jgi:hypothetical protein
MNWKVDCEDCSYSKLVTSPDEWESIEERAKNARDVHANFHSHDVSANPVDENGDVVEHVDEEAGQ